MKTILMVEREELLEIINRLRQLRVAREPNVELAIDSLQTARRWLLKEAERYESRP